MPFFEVIADFTKTRSFRKLIEADDPQEAGDKARADINGCDLSGWTDWDETPDTPEIVSVEEVSPRGTGS
jgi:hypothetical protein